MITREKFIENVKIKNKKSDNIEIVGEYTGSNNPIKCRCKIDGHIWSPIAFQLYRAGCPVCANRIVVRGINDLWTTHPYIAKLLTNPEEGYSIMAGSKGKKSFTCPNCNTTIFQNIIDVVKRGYISCKACNDNISTPNKIMYHLLSQLDVEFETEKSFDWSVNKNGNKVKYDFFIPAYNSIVEMHGLQHYERAFHEDSRTLEEEQENDRLKENLALSNNIAKYVVIDARLSDYEYIKNNILNSQLSKILDLTNINWTSVFLNSSKSFVYEVAKLCNKNYTIGDICKTLHFDRNIVRSYLIKAKLAKLCNYTCEESKQRKFDREAKKVVCIEDNLIYDSIEQVGRELGISANSVRRCCDLSKENLRSLKKKHYLLYDDFLSMPVNQIVDILKKPMGASAKPLFCIEENRIFNNVQEIHDWCGICHATICRYLDGKIDYAGIHPITKEQLHWRQVTDDDIISSYDLNNLKEKLVYA